MHGDHSIASQTRLPGADSLHFPTAFPDRDPFPDHDPFPSRDQRERFLQQSRLDASEVPQDNSRADRVHVSVAGFGQIHAFGARQQVLLKGV